MREYPFLRLFDGYGAWLSLVIALGFLGLTLLLLAQSSLLNMAGAALALLGAVVLWLFLRTLTDIVKLLSETLIPRP